MIMAKDSNNNYVKIEDIKQQNSFNGISPIEFKGSGENLENYRIYGNTVGGESVGDKTENLWNVEVVDNYSSYTNGKINQYAGRCTNIEPIVVDGNSYILSYSAPSNASCIVMIKNSGELISRVFKSGSIIMIDTSGGNELYITWFINDTTSITSDMIQDIMLNIGSTALPYEPYGYRVPVTVEGKNLFQTTTSSQTKNGVTFTVNNDGSVICNGTASKDTFFKIGDLPLASQSYILTGCPSDGGNDSYMLRCYKNGNIKGGDVGNGFNINDSIDGYGYIEIRIASGYTCDNLTFYPMIRKADIEDNTYEPYRTPVTTPIYLPEPLKMVGNEAEYVDYETQKQHRVRKNLLNEEYIQGNPISNSIIRVKCKTPIPLVKGELYTISFDSGSLFDVSLGSSPTPEYPFVADTTILSSCGNSLNWLTSPYTFECVNDGYISVTIRKKDNTSITPDEVNFAIQFEKNSTATSYEPCIENTELDVTLPALPTLFGTNILSVNTNTKPSKVWGRLSDSKDILYVKDSLGNTLFSKYHESSGPSPLTYEAKKAGNLNNYKICGNTIEGESVGDKTDNIIRDYAVVRTQAQYAVVLSIDTELISNTTYSFTCLLNSSELRLYINENLFNTISYVKDDVVLKVIVETLSELPDSQKINGKWIMLKNSITEPVVPELSNIMMIKGSEMPAIYEPYGYRVPVTVSNGTDTQTTNIYLPEPLKMVGNEPEYIDYREQKQHRVRKNLLNYSSIEIGRFDFSTGEKMPDSSQFRTSTPIKVKPYESYAISGVASGQVRVFLYDGNMNMISTVLRSDNSVVETTGSTVFVNVAGIKSAWSEQIQLEIGSEATGYEPYIEDIELNVTLPALPTVTKTNVLSVGTEVLPSKVYIKGKIKEIN